MILNLVMEVRIVNGNDKNKEDVQVRSPEKIFDFVERAIALSLEVDSLLGIGLRRHPLEAFNEQKSQIEVYLSMNRLFFWVVDAQNYINGGWIYGGIIRDIEYHVREQSRIMKLFYGPSASTSSGSSSSSSESSGSDSDENFVEKMKNEIFGGKHEKVPKTKQQQQQQQQQQQHAQIVFDAQERQLMRAILAEFKITATRIAEPFRDLLFYMYFNQKLLQILNNNGGVHKYLDKLSHPLGQNNAKNGQKVPSRLLDRHVYIHRWLCWVTVYAEAWLTKLISLAIRIGTLNMDNCMAPFAKCICRHFDRMNGGHFDENYTVESGNFLWVYRKQRQIDQAETENEQTQQEFLGNIVAQSLALRNLLIILADEAYSDFSCQYSNDSDDPSGSSSTSSSSYFTTIFSKTLHPLSIKNVHSKHGPIVQHLTMLVLFFRRIFELVIVPQIWLLNKFNVDNELKQLKHIYEATIRALTNIENN